MKSTIYDNPIPVQPFVMEQRLLIPNLTGFPPHFLMSVQIGGCFLAADIT